MASIVEMEDNFADHADNSINTLTNESIDDLEKVLRGHENILKSVLNSYEKLKERYSKLENAYLTVTKKANIEENNHDAEDMSELVKNLETQLKASERKLK